MPKTASINNEIHSLALWSRAPQRLNLAPRFFNGAINRISLLVSPVSTAIDVDGGDLRQEPLHHAATTFGQFSGRFSALTLLRKFYYHDFRSMGWHEVQQGEHVTSIADQYGFSDHQEIWNQPPMPS